MLKTPHKKRSSPKASISFEILRKRNFGPLQRKEKTCSRHTHSVCARTNTITCSIHKIMCTSRTCRLLSFSRQKLIRLRISKWVGAAGGDPVFFMGSCEAGGVCIQACPQRRLVVRTNHHVLPVQRTNLLLCIYSSKILCARIYLALYNVERLKWCANTLNRSPFYS